MKKLFNLMLGFALMIFTLFWLSSYAHYYNTLGVDSEQQKGEFVDYHYYRFWWPGNGALLIGRGITTKKYDANVHYDSFDLGAAFFRPKYKKLEAKTLWNRVGFWYVSSARQVWIGVPAWLPVLMILGYFLYLKRKS